MCFVGVARMPKKRTFKVQSVGLGLFGVVLGMIATALLIPAVRVRVSDIFWFSAKVGVFMYLYIWYRGTFPRYRFDQLMKVGWKVLLPVSLAVLIAVGVIGVWPDLAKGLMGVAR
jgi:NADH-quinone oxidoreductase subunit H